MNEPSAAPSHHHGLILSDGADRGKIRIQARAVCIDGYWFKDVDLVCDLAVLGAGGRDAGVEAVSTFYGLYLIADPAGGSLSCLFSTNLTAPSFERAEQYRHSLRVGSRLNNATGDLYRMFHRGGWQEYNENCQGAPFTIVTYPAAAITYTAASVAGITPTVATDVLIYAYANNNGVVGSLVCYVRPTGSNWATGNHAEIIRTYNTAGGNDHSNSKRMPIGTSQSIDWRGGRVTDLIGIYVAGFYDPASVSG